MGTKHITPTLLTPEHPAGDLTTVVTRHPTMDSPLKTST